MTQTIVLTEEEEVLLANLIPSTARDRTVQGLVNRWDRIIAEVEDGYKLTIDDYTNDLSIREILSRIAEATSPQLKTKIISMLAPLDERFTQATFISARPPFPGALKRNPEAWWYKRLPRKLVDELKEDSDRLGLVSSSPL